MQMNKTITIEEDARLAELRFQSSLLDIKKSTPKIFLIGMVLSVIFSLMYWGLFDPDIVLFVKCILVTPIMLAMLWIMLLAGKYSRRKWMINNHCIRMSDGFFIPWKMIHSWSIKDFEEISGLCVLSVTNNALMQRSIIVQNSDALSQLIEELKNKANLQVESIVTTPGESGNRQGTAGHP